MNRIVVGLDGSSRAASVLDAAITIARARSARLVLLRSVGMPPDVPQDMWKTSDEPLLDVLEHRARQYLNEQQARVPAELLGGSEVVLGVPWEGVCHAADRLHADLIVIGSHGYSGLDKLLGTTAGKVVNHAHCSVLVVRSPQPAAAPVSP